MAKAERDDALNTLASRLFAAMLDDIVVDLAIQSHQEVARSKRKCDICQTHCRQVHTPAPSGTSVIAAAAGIAASSSQSTQPSSRPGTPSRDAVTPAPSGTPTSGVNKDGTVLLDCVGCGRPISSNRYASHLSNCIGAGTGTRRAAARNATSKSKLGSDAGRSASPYPGSENGNVSDHNAPLPPPGPKKKGRPPKNKPKRTAASVQVVNAANDDGESLSNRKRPGSPLSSPAKNTKKQKVSAGPPSRAGTNSPLAPPGAKSQSKIPSRLRESSIASFPDATGASPGSRSSSPATVATPTSSLGNGRVNGASGGGEEKRMAPHVPTPPRPPPPVTRRPETDYLVDVEGDETGSSTDSSE